MTSGTAAVAISTTGETHRMPLLEQSARMWWLALAARSLPTSIYVTVDGSEEDAERVALAVFGTALVYRVGQPASAEPYSGRLGVATNKNTGLELLMEQTDAEHLFLSDDDTWPLIPQALDKHINMSTNNSIQHSMVCWGHHRLEKVRGDAAKWSWPRGVMLYAHRSAVEVVGGMLEAFGPGGHEHVEWSNRIHNAGLTPAPYVSPPVYAEMGEVGPAMRAGTLWHCEDMKRPGEPLGNHRQRRRELTTIRRQDGDWEKIEKIMRSQEGSTAFVPFRASENSRSSATLSQYNRAEEPEKA